ncbi:MAG: 2-oxoacid:acceptor oxidoreductase family protein [Calditrichota bacterium]
MKHEIRFAGVGGQGNILAGEWLALAAHSMGKHAIQSPTYTAQVRGGPTSVDVLIDDDEIVYPRLVAIDFFCCLAQEGWNVFSRQLKPDSIIVIAPSLVNNVGNGPQMIYRVPIISITKQTVGKMVYTSAVALGSFCSLMPEIIPQDIMVRTIEKNAPAGTVENNLKAFHAGWEATKATTPEARDDIAKEAVTIQV